MHLLCSLYSVHIVYSVHMLKAYDESSIRKFNRFWSCLFSNSRTIHDSLNVCSGTSHCMPNSGTIVLTANYEYSWKVHVSLRRRANAAHNCETYNTYVYSNMNVLTNWSCALNLAERFAFYKSLPTINDSHFLINDLVRLSVCHRKNWQNFYTLSLSKDH